MQQYLSKNADAILKNAKDLARKSGQHYVGTEHLLMAIVQAPSSLGAKVLTRLGATEERICEQTSRLLQVKMQETWVLGRLPGTPHFKDVISKAASAARGTGNWQVSSEHLLAALLDERGSVACDALKALGITPEAVRKAMAEVRCPVT